jgi:lipoprotein-anchoring transpeptidase ErfK/SrfK
MKSWRLILALILLCTLWHIFAITNSVVVQQLDYTGMMRICVNFFIPVKCDDIEGKIHFTSENPNLTIIKSVKWVEDDLLEILAFEQGLAKGYKLKMYIEPLKTGIPGLYKRVRHEFRPDIFPFLTGVSDIVPRKGPIVLNFSTPVKMESITKRLDCGFDFELKQAISILQDDSYFKDFSKFFIIPIQPLLPGKKYEITCKGAIENYAGQRNTGGFYSSFSVADVPNVVSTDPASDQKDVNLYTPIHVNFDQEMKDVKIQVSGMKGDVELSGSRAVFKPYTVYMAHKTYEVEVEATSIFDERIKPHKFKFTTVDMTGKTWVEINLRPIQKVVVYQGGRVVRSMVASAGLPEPENRTPRGYFNLKDRGEYFWTEKIQEGGFYWVRITGNFLIHSLPRDKDNKIIEEELKRLGIPASHGCVRLRDEEAKWFYDTIPSGTLVIIHD